MYLQSILYMNNKYISNTFLIEAYIVSIFDSETFVIVCVTGMILYKFWSVWTVSKDAKASREGKLIFLGLIGGASIFGIMAKLYISMAMGLS